MFSFLHDPRARSINLLERFFFFIDRVHLGVPDGKRVIEIHHYQSHQRVVGVPLTASTAWENTKNTKRERKSEKASPLRDFLKDVNPGFNSFLKLVATLRELLENFFSQMRSRNDMPTALEFAYLFAPTIRESLKKLTDTGFVYYTSPHSYCEVPDEMKLPFRDLPSLSVPSSVEMAKDGQRLMRDWRDSFGKPVRQLTV